MMKTNEKVVGYICDSSLREGMHAVAAGLRECVVACGAVACELAERHPAAPNCMFCCVHCFFF